MDKNKLQSIAKILHAIIWIYAIIFSTVGIVLLIMQYNGVVIAHENIIRLIAGIIYASCIIIAVIYDILMSKVINSKDEV